MVISIDRSLMGIEYTQAKIPRQPIGIVCESINK